jgi:hypothetical protein
MEDATFIMGVMVLAVGGLLGVAYSLDIRRKRYGVLGPKLPPAGRLGRRLWLAARLLTALMVLLAAAAYAWHSAWLAGMVLGLFLLFFADHTAYRIVRLTGK